MITTLTRAHLVTTDVARLARFYERLVGVVAAGSNEYVELPTPGAALSICSRCAFEMHGSLDLAVARRQSILLDFEVPDVHKVRSILDAMHMTSSPVAMDQPWGARTLLVHDPDGNLVNFFSRTPRGTFARRAR